MVETLYTAGQAQNVPALVVHHRPFASVTNRGHHTMSMAIEFSRPSFGTIMNGTPLPPHLHVTSDGYQVIFGTIFGTPSSGEKRSISKHDLEQLTKVLDDVRNATAEDTVLKVSAAPGVRYGQLLAAIEVAMWAVPPSGHSQVEAYLRDAPTIERRFFIEYPFHPPDWQSDVRTTRP